MKANCSVRFPVNSIKNSVDVIYVIDLFILPQDFVHSVQKPYAPLATGTLIKLLYLKRTEEYRGP